MKAAKVDLRVIEKNLPEQNQVHEKSWGSELWIENLPDYCGKILRFKGGHGTSLHYHLDKLETMHLSSGKLNVKLINPDTCEIYHVTMLPGDTLRIPRGCSHQLIALEDSQLFEFSTMHREDDSYRVWKGI